MTAIFQFMHQKAIFHNMNQVELDFGSLYVSTFTAGI
jgi:hypothetical protein